LRLAGMEYFFTQKVRVEAEASALGCERGGD
jgi:hypothetical protein